ncbi:MAG: D-tyrosyl-tRNA(Tyr) deacylase [Syntrophomonadaceae bacterium]|nr:D-tyrosyl-tRNA(Tyr) deacylase [Syntrophomonadaceae bacterium]
MRAIVQRTTRSTVVINNEVTAAIDEGLMVLLGIKSGDTENEARYIIDKLINLRIFPDEAGKMNLSLLDIKGELLLVSQFTLYGDVRKGRRPSFTEAELPDIAEHLFNYCVNYAKLCGVKTEVGIFGADMKINIVNDGPCTILLDSEKIF